MASTIVTKNSSTASAVPVSGDLTQGELAVNVTDKRLFTKNSGGTVVELGTNPASLALPNGTTNGVAYLNGSKVVTTGSALTFDGTNLTLGGGYMSLNGNGYFRTDIAGYLAMQAGSTGYVWRSTGNAGDWMTLTSTGLGIGTSSPVSRLDVRAASAVIGNYQQIQAFSTDTAAINLGGGISLGGYYSGTSGLASFGTIVGRKENSTDGNYAGYLAFGTNAQATGVVERARIDSSGNLLVGKTALSSAERFSLNYNGNTGQGIVVNDSAGVSSACMWFQNTGTTIGSISKTTTAVAYNTSSDYRLKNTIAPMTGALAKVALLKPCTYKWNTDGSDGEGFIAHELAEVVPQCVTGEKDAVDADGNPQYQGIDTSFLVATLTAAIQELKAEFDAYKATHP
jgi:Chaperone of endosialidase